MRGMTVTLYAKTQTGTDPFGAPVWEETPVPVENVLVGQPTTEELTEAADLYGKRVDFVLGIPKGDGNEWQDRTVEWTAADGRTVRCETVGFPVMGVEALVPGPWHKKVRCRKVE